MDEVEWSRKKTKPLNGFEDAQHKPVPLLLGLTIGLALAWIPTLLSPVFAPLPPLIVGGVLTLFPRTQALALGMVAAAGGVVTFLVATVLVQLIL